MTTSKQLQILAIPTMLVLLINGMMVSTAYADDETPPPTGSSSEAVPPPAVETRAAENPSAAVADPASEVFIPSLPAKYPQGEGTDLVVLDENGTSLPLASQTAADIVASGDPMWCPSGAAPRPGLGGCSPSFNHFGYAGDGDPFSLINWLVTNQPNKAGKIWMEYNYDALLNETTGTVELSSADYATMDNFALTIQGGWEGTPGSTALHTADPYSYFNWPNFMITGWTGAVTINNIILDDSGGPSSYGSDDSALLVVTKSNIVLNRVTARNNINSTGFVRNGIFLDTTTGTTGGSVTLLNVTSSGNESAGITIFSTGAVTATNTFAEGNASWGLYINNTFSLTDAAVTMKGYQQFNDNGSAATYPGLSIVSKGTVTLANLAATDNYGDGVYIDNTTSAGAKGVTVNGTNFFSYNGLQGLEILSHGNITTNNLTSMGNTKDGADLYNCDFNGTGCDGRGLVKMNGVNSLHDNGTDGLAVYSYGAITVSNLSAYGNAHFGADIANNTCNSTCALPSKAGITLLGYATFTDNFVDGDDGLDMASNGSITASNLTASNNGYNGVSIDNHWLGWGLPANVTLKGTNTFNDNANNGLDLNSYGTVLINNATANNNGAISTTGNGILVNNHNFLTPKALTFTGFVVANSNYVYGITLASDGVVTLNNVTADGNTTGLYINNTDFIARQMAVTLKGANNFSNNISTGVYVVSYGVITANSVTAVNNGAYVLAGPLMYGAYFNNTGGTLAKNVILTGVNTFDRNYMQGLWVSTDGTVTLSRVTADHNDWDEGTNPDGHSGDGIVAFAGGSITLTCAHTRGNWDYGYDLTSSGGVVYFKGMYSAYNGSGDSASPSPIITACALP